MIQKTHIQTVQITDQYHGIHPGRVASVAYDCGSTEFAIDTKLYIYLEKILLKRNIKMDEKSSVTLLIEIDLTKLEIANYRMSTYSSVQGPTVYDCGSTKRSGARISSLCLGKNF